MVAALLFLILLVDLVQQVDRLGVVLAEKARAREIYVFILHVAFNGHPWIDWLSFIDTRVDDCWAFVKLGFLQDGLSVEESTKLERSTPLCGRSVYQFDGLDTHSAIVAERYIILCLGTRFHEAHVFERAGVPGCELLKSWGR